MTQKSLVERLRELHEAATAGPWDYERELHGGDLPSPWIGRLEAQNYAALGLGNSLDERLANAALIVFLRNNVDHFLNLEAENERLRRALPLIEAIATWEREHGTAALIMPGEYEPFCKAIMEAALKSSARTTLGDK